MTSGSPLSPLHFSVIACSTLAVMVLLGWSLTPLDYVGFLFLGFVAPGAVYAWINRRRPSDRPLVEPSLPRPRSEIVTMAQGLSTERAARIPSWRTEWMRLCTGAAPPDRRRAEAAVSEL